MNRPIHMRESLDVWAFDIVLLRLNYFQWGDARTKWKEQLHNNTNAWESLEWVAIIVWQEYTLESEDYYNKR